MNHLKILLIICAIIIAVIAIAVIVFYSTTPKLKVATISSSELNSTGNCTIVNSQVQLANESTISCNVGERFEGFKLLKVNPASIQILIYDDCEACMHDATNGNQFVEIINVSMFQSFGSPCEGIPPTQLEAVNIKNNVSTAIFHSNMSGTMYCM